MMNAASKIIKINALAGDAVFTSLFSPLINKTSKMTRKIKTQVSRPECLVPCHHGCSLSCKHHSKRGKVRVFQRLQKQKVQ